MKLNKLYLFTISVAITTVGGISWSQENTQQEEGLPSRRVLVIKKPDSPRVETGPKLDEERLSRLLAVLSERAPSIPVPPEIQRNDKKKREQFLAERKARFAAHDAKVNAAAEELAAMGDDIVDWLVRKYRIGGRGVSGQKIVTVLAKIGTPKARSVLLDMALGKNGLMRSTWAADNFIKITPDKEDRLQLLESDDPLVLHVGLQSVRGVHVDAKLLKALRHLLQFPRSHLRIQAAMMIANDSNPELASDKVAAIIESLRTVEEMPGAQERLEVNSAATLADNMYHYLIVALTRTEGATPFLRNATEELEGEPKAAVVVARGLRGDSTARQALRELLRNSRMVSRITIRGHATRAMGVVGTREDIPFLEQLLEDDPLEVVSFNGPVFARVNGEYVNTGPRMAPIKSEDDPAWKTARRSYPIRDRAQNAIRTIEKRLEDQD